MKIGVNTFGLGPYLKKNEPAVWNGLREAGVTAIEPCIAFHPAEPQTETEKAARERGRFAGVFSASSAAEKIRFWRSMGFEVYSFQLQSHVFSVEAVAEAVPFMKQHGLRYCIFNFMERSVEKVSRHREGILEAVRMLREEGLEFLVHNHDMEWLPDSGTSVMQWLLDNIPENMMIIRQSIPFTGVIDLCPAMPLPSVFRPAFSQRVMTLLPACGHRPAMRRVPFSWPSVRTAPLPGQTRTAHPAGRHFCFLPAIPCPGSFPPAPAAGTGSASGRERARMS